MNQNHCIIITSIQGSENKVLRSYAMQCSEKNVGFIVAGDTKTPENFNLAGCDYLSIETQKKLPFILSGLLPHKNYAKKNIAYLQAIKKGYSILIETDDDNLPTEEFWNLRNLNVKGDIADNNGWVNVYSYFSDTFIWPRGFSLKHLKDPFLNLKQTSNATFSSPIQQALVNENPDVDAIYRLCMELPFNFQKREPVVLAGGSVCPFNSQNTTWFKEAFPLLYLPSYCSFRMCDIWRSFIAQRILWENNWHLSFHSSNAYQQRNEHDLIKDFEDEISGYLNNEAIMADLRSLHLKKGEQFIFENLKSCYTLMISKNYLDQRELPLLEAWIKDLKSLD